MYFLKTEVKNEWNVDFLRNTPSDLLHTYSIGFFIDRSTSEIPLWLLYKAALLLFFGWILI